VGLRLGLSRRLREARDLRRHEVSCATCFMLPLGGEVWSSCFRPDRRTSSLDRAMANYL